MESPDSYSPEAHSHGGDSALADTVGLTDTLAEAIGNSVLEEKAAEDTLALEEGHNLAVSKQELEGHCNLDWATREPLE